MSLKYLDNQELIENTKSALKIACEAEVEVLRHFQEIEERKLWTGAGSLYKYIAVTFGLTADQIGPNDASNLQWLCGFHNRHRFKTRRSASGDQVSRSSGKNRKPDPGGCHDLREDREPLS